MGHALFLLELFRCGQKVTVAQAGGEGVGAAAHLPDTLPRRVGDIGSAERDMLARGPFQRTRQLLAEIASQHAPIVNRYSRQRG